MVEEKKDKKARKPSNLQLERSLSITSQTSECRNADLSPGVPNNHHPPTLQHMLSVEQRNSLLKPSATSVHESACCNLSPDVGKSCRSPEAAEGVPMVDNIRNHKMNKDAVVLEMARGIELKLQERSVRQGSATMSDGQLSSASSKRPKLKFYLLVAIAFVVMLLLISGLLTGIFFTINQASLRSLVDEIDVKGPSTEFCVPCGDLRLSSDPSDDVRHDFSVRTPRGGKQLCCAHTDNQRQHIIELLVAKGIAQEKIRDMVPPPIPPKHQGSNPSPNPGPNTPQAGSSQSTTPTTTTPLPVLGNAHVAQVYLETQDSAQVADEIDYRVLKGWQDSFGFVKKGVAFDESKGRFTITESGVYHLSLHLSYLPSDRDSEHIFGAKIARENINFPWEGVEELVSDRVTKTCDVRQHHKFVPCHTLSLDAIVKLRLGDQIFVMAHQETKNMLEISDQRHRVSFFGLYQIDHS